MEYTELNHYSRLPIEKFLEYLDIKVQSKDADFISMGDELNIKYPSGKITEIEVDNKTYWGYEEEIEFHKKMLSKLINKDELKDYAFGYIAGTMHPYGPDVRGMMSASMTEGYTLWTAMSEYLN